MVQETTALTGLMLTMLRSKAIPELTKPQLGFINKQARVGILYSTTHICIAIMTRHDMTCVGKTEGIRVNCVAMLGAIGQLPAHHAHNFVRINPFIHLLSHYFLSILITD
jgi:hypothetical protein